MEVGNGVLAESGTRRTSLWPGVPYILFTHGYARMLRDWLLDCPDAENAFVLPDQQPDDRSTASSSNHGLPDFRSMHQGN